MRKRIGLREIKQLEPGQSVWDTVVPGFHARRRTTEAIFFCLHYRLEGRQRWLTIGQFGAPWTPDSARREAQRLLGTIVEGADPVAIKRSKRQAATVAELCDLYIADVEAGRTLTRAGQPKRASTLATDRGRIERHIRPLLGQLKVAAVTTADIDGFLHDVAAGKTAARIKTKARGVARVRGGRGTASRTVGLLGAIFTYAQRHGMRPDNPVRGVMRFADGQRTRRLSDSEYAAFGRALRSARAEGIWPSAVTAMRFLLLSGWRSGEVLALRWRDIDLVSRSAVIDTKTGRSMRPLSKHACEVLGQLTKVSGNSLVFPATRGSGPMTGFRKLWNRVTKLGGPPSDVTPHVLRHSFASLGDDLGFSEVTIATLIGHKKRSMTGRYTHKPDPVLLAAADTITSRILQLMAGAGDQAAA